MALGFPFLCPNAVNFQSSLGCFILSGTYITYKNSKEGNICSKDEITNVKYPNLEILTINAYFLKIRIVIIVY